MRILTCLIALSLFAIQPARETHFFMLSFLMLIAGMALLMFAGDYLVRGSVGLAARFEINPLIIGLTVVAFGTSAPELFVSLQAAWNGVSGIAIGNVVGSNIANTGLVLGATALIAALPVKSGLLRQDLPALLAVTAVTGFLCSDYISLRTVLSASQSRSRLCCILALLGNYHNGMLPCTCY